MAGKKKPKRVLLKQLLMRRVLLALLPCIAGAVYFFGWRSLALVVWAGVVGFITEYIFTRLRGEPVTESVFVTTTIFALIMPPTVPWHVVAIGVVFSVMFTKEIFGGFGRNFFNPAMAGRCFVYICFPVALTAVWSPAAEGVWGALDRWTTASRAQRIDSASEGGTAGERSDPMPTGVPSLLPPRPQAVTGATPMAYLKMGRMTLVSEEPALSEAPFDIPEDETVRVRRNSFWAQQFFGRISGTMGATSVLLILIGGIYLFYTKTASRTLILTVIVTYAGFTQLLYMFGVPPVPSGLTALLGGGWLFGAFFMVTDPISAPKTEAGRVIYAILIGIASAVIRNFSIFNGGLMFAILLGNMFAPIIDYGVRARMAAAKQRLEGKEATA
jgi:Na+-transporting NADH:ubiquinone oxidoreductase subunit B